MTRHIIMSNEKGASTLTKTQAPDFESLDFAGWRGRSVEDSGVFTFLFDIAADAVEFPLHVDDAEWLALVISGSGTLFAGTADMEKTDGMAYEAGDYITFEGGTPHGWINNGEPSRILFVKRA